MCVYICDIGGNLGLLCWWCNIHWAYLRRFMESWNKNQEWLCWQGPAALYHTDSGRGAVCMHALFCSNAKYTASTIIYPSVLIEGSLAQCFLLGGFCIHIIYRKPPIIMGDRDFQLHILSYIMYNDSQRRNKSNQNHESSGCMKRKTLTENHVNFILVFLWESFRLIQQIDGWKISDTDIVTWSQIQAAPTVMALV
jgi:hypothetical protein